MTENPERYSEEQAWAEAERMQRMLRAEEDRKAGHIHEDELAKSYAEAEQQIEERKRARIERYRQLYGEIDLQKILVDSTPDGVEAKKILSEVERQIRADFPETADVSKHPANEFIAELKDFYHGDERALQIINRELTRKKYPVNFLRDFGYLHDKVGQDNNLYYAASFLKGSRLDKDHLERDLRDSLVGKKILVLGDDSGSLSEIFGFYGAKCYGVEYDEFKILVAQSGILSENGKPQKQVMLGNIADLFLENSDLKKKLMRLRPFDLIVSYAVFNTGSGIEKLIPYDELDYQRHVDFEQPGLSVNFQRNSQELLSESGLQLHTEVDMRDFLPRQYELPTSTDFLIPKSQRSR